MARTRDDSTPLVEPVPGSEHQVVGRRFLRLIEDQLRLLRALPAHGNRNVFLDHLAVAHLIAFFNPTVKGLRSIEDIFENPRARKRLGLPRLPKSTVSDAQSVFDPELLRPILDSLRQRTGLQPHDTRLDEITRKLIAVDGSFLTVASRIAWAIFNNSGKGNVRMHVQFNVFDGLPDHVTLTDGQSSETEQLRHRLRPDCFFVMDRGFQDYGLFKDIIDVGSDFLVRLRKSACTPVLEERPLSVADRAEGVTRDAVIQLGSRPDQMPDLPPLRLVEIHFTDRDGKAQFLRLLTNRLDLSAWMIGLIYQHRWQVELFFRWLKCSAHFNHFFSESQGGMTLQVYVTMIGLLLIAVETGAKPSRYDYALMSAAVAGLMTVEESVEIAARRRAERQRAAEWQKAYNARKKNAK